jgi:hypothetical protein
MKNKKRLEDYTWEELLVATSGKEGMREGGREIGQYTKENKLGIHTDNQELKEEWASMGGDASIEQLLQWQKDNDYSIGDLEKTETHKKNIGLSNKGKVRTTETKNQISETLINFNSSLSQEERSNKYSNNARANAARIKKIEILNSIESDEFTSPTLVKVCKKFGYDYKLLARDRDLLELVYKGTNGYNPSIYKKIK